METKQVTQVKIYILALNYIEGKSEHSRGTVASTDKQKLIDWYNDQLCAPYRCDYGYTRNFKKESKLYWYNPTDINIINDWNGAGIYEDWINLDTLNPENFIYYY